MTTTIAHLGNHIHLHAGDMIASALITTLLLALCSKLTNNTK